MASKASDSFNRIDQPLVQAETGQPWVWHRGRGDIRNNRAVFANNGLLTVDTGIGGGDMEGNVSIIPNDGGGQAFYFRVIDVNRWWRLCKRQYTTSYTYQSGTTPATYGWVGNGTYYYEPAGGFVYRGTAPSDGRPAGSYYEAYDYRVNAYLSYTYIYRHADGRMVQDHYYPRSVYENQSYVQTGGGQPIYATGYQTNTEVALEKCVNGVVTRVKSVGVSSGIRKLGIHASGSRITALVDDATVWGIVDDATHQTAHLHGIGHAETSETGNSSGIESFSATPFVLAGYVPYVML